ncbi:MAG: dTDP-4-dehydrorhamnose reductase [Melioribacteraceae bacterium]|nr:dTDP-4-dehydrorhamnose reductase [Melioribacteraceae bacterium]
MLGQRLVHYYYTDNNVELLCCSNEKESFIPGIDYRELDISVRKDVKKIFNEFYPDVVINAAAYTNVDKCETEKELAWRINVEGVENLMYFSKVIDAHLIHISTDYVFDGKEGPYTEDAPVNPVGYYGRTKLASENLLVASGGDYTIIRTNVLYGPVKYGRPDFVKWVVTSLREGNEIRIVDDQYNNPTYIDDLVKAIDAAIRKKAVGIYHIGGREVLNRYEFTLRIADFFDLEKSLIKRIKTEDLNQAARRPLKSGLVIQKAEKELDYFPKSIEKSFEKMRQEIDL